MTVNMFVKCNKEPLTLNAILLPKLCRMRHTSDMAECKQTHNYASSKENSIEL